jgi:anaerobic ribonucleoside-triphosphate reductase activating protein
MREQFLEALIGRYASAITCFCFMGGDAEPSEIERLAFWIKEKYPHVKTAWYSGNDRIAEGFDILSLDYVKIGPFRQELGGLKSPTTNQALYMIESDGNLKRIYL